MSQNYKKLAEKQIALGKPLAIIKNSLEKYLLAEDKAEWNRVMQDEYDLLFPTYRDPNAEEVYEQQEHYLNNASNEVLLREDVDFSEFIYAQVEIDYSEDETYVPFNEWLNETRVITKAVEEERDAEGNVVVEAVAEVTEQVRSYTAITPDEIEVQVIAYLTDSGYLDTKAKEEKVKAKDELVVIQDELQFQGDAGSVNYMSAVLATANFKMFQALSEDVTIKSIYDAIYGSTIGWKTADNKIEATTIENLGSALEKSMQEIAKIIGAK